MRDENRVKKCEKYLILLNKLAGVVQWQNGSFPSCIRGFDSLRPLQGPFVGRLRLSAAASHTLPYVGHSTGWEPRQLEDRALSVHWRVRFWFIQDTAGEGAAHDVARKKPALLRAFCITSLGIRLRRSRRLYSGRHNHNRHSKAAERSRSFHSTAERNRSFHNTVGSDDSRNGGNYASVDGAS